MPSLASELRSTFIASTPAGCVGGVGNAIRIRKNSRFIRSSPKGPIIAHGCRRGSGLVQLTQQVNDFDPPTDDEQVLAITNDDLRMISFELRLQVESTGKYQVGSVVKRHAAVIAERLESQRLLNLSKEVPLVESAGVTRGCRPVRCQCVIDNRAHG